MLLVINISLEDFEISGNYPFDEKCSKGLKDDKFQCSRFPISFQILGIVAFVGDFFFNLAAPGNFSVILDIVKTCQIFLNLL